LIIVADQHIPFVEDVFSGLGELILIPGQDITQKSLESADVLIVRSVTQIDRDLMENSTVRFVGSATAGIDHVDVAFLQGANIHFCHAPGANAESVVEYVFACLSTFSKWHGESFLDRTIGIVGAGNVGGLLAQRCKSLGMKTLVNDPPLAALNGSDQFCTLSSLIRQSDILSIHTPLHKTGEFATAKLIGAAELAKMRQNVWLVHSARGGVCDEKELIKARLEGRIGALALDVWENEPTPSLRTVDAADIATGHIAGYSLDAKKAGISKLRKDLISFFGRPEMQTLQNRLPTKDGGVGDGSAIEPSTDEPGIQFQAGDSISDLIQSLYPVLDDDHRFRSAMIQSSESPRAIADSFHHYRATYPVRRRFGAHSIMGTVPALWREVLLKPDVHR
jgi:erythronate-4-phosphate dehydrogenase